jgi:hypothetical protein
MLKRALSPDPRFAAIMARIGLDFLAQPATNPTQTYDDIYRQCGSLHLPQ